MCVYCSRCCYIIPASLPSSSAAYIQPNTFTLARAATTGGNIEEVKKKTTTTHSNISLNIQNHPFFCVSHVPFRSYQCVVCMENCIVAKNFDRKPMSSRIIYRWGKLRHTHHGNVMLDYKIA